MQVHEIKKPKHLTLKRRVGRGGKRGTYSGKGIKGQKARAGGRIRPQILDYIFKIPKFAGPTRKRADAGAGSKHQGTVRPKPIFTVNLDALNAVVKNGDVVNKKFLQDSGLIKKHKGNVKILGSGQIEKEITVESLNLSKIAQEKITKAGGTIKS
jgi:large subunit ribosomal protein L15